MDKTIIILMGLQGSGKSTFYKTYLEDSFVRVNLDTLKTRYQEDLLIKECIKKGESFAVDNTNPTRLERKKYIDIAKTEGYRVVGYFLESKIKDCMARNALREGKARVPDIAIAATSNKLEIPSFEEGFNELYFVKNNGTDMIIEKWRKQ